MSRLPLFHPAHVTPSASSPAPLPTLWPTQVDFQDALQNPASCFTDADLQAAVPADLTPFGLPRPITGQFANVYRFRRADGSLCAVRLFIGPSSDRKRRYDIVAPYLDTLAGSLPSLVPITYENEGIYLRGGTYPLVRMDWISGPTLNAYVDAHLYEGGRLRGLAEQFRRLAHDLGAAQIAHGDLQHGNILVEETADGGRLRLIDYDGMWVPGLAAADSVETGHPSYQHPRRSPRDHGPFLDRFSVLVIYAALRTVAVAPNVWFRLDNGDNLLFRRDDFRNPRDSEGFAILRESLLRLPEERALIDAVARACAEPAARAPELETLFR